MSLTEDSNLTALEERLGYRFTDLDLLRRALTHRSAVEAPGNSYERLEFLGDRVLGLVIADMLYVRFPDDPEGSLSRRLNDLVCKETLAKVAQSLEIGEYLRLGPSESVPGRTNASILCDAMEAVIAALYLDGGKAPAQSLIERHWSALLKAEVKPRRDAKSALQEWTMARGLGLPNYEEIARSGPDHAPLFTIQVSIPGHAPMDAQGHSKRMAEQAAAAALLATLESHGNGHD